MEGKPRWPFIHKTTLVYAKEKLNIYTYIHIVFSTIHDAYIYVIRIANTSQKRSHSRGEEYKFEKRICKIYLAS